MKVQLLESFDSPGKIEGYEHIVITSFSYEIEFPDNSIDEIVLQDCLSVISRDQIINFIGSVCKKLRKNGCVIIQSIDLLSICRALVNGDIDPAQFNTYSNEKNLYQIEEIIKAFNNFNLQSEYFSVKGINFEAKFVRT